MYSQSKVYYYWEGNKPDWIRLCEETMDKHLGDKLVKLNRENIYQYLKLPEYYWKITKPNHKTDYLKARLIYENGGFWIDADTIVLQYFTDWISYFDKYDFIGTPGFFGGPKGSKTIGDWANAMEEIIKVKSEYHFAELINPLITRKEYNPFVPLTKEQFCPFWYEGELHKAIFDNSDIKQFVTDKTKLVILFNNCFPDWFKLMTREQILNKQYNICKIFRKSLCL